MRIQAAINHASNTDKKTDGAGIPPEPPHERIIDSVTLLGPATAVAATGVALMGKVAQGANPLLLPLWFVASAPLGAYGCLAASKLAESMGIERDPERTANLTATAGYVAAMAFPTPALLVVLGIASPSKTAAAVLAAGTALTAGFATL